MDRQPFTIALQHTGQETGRAEAWFIPGARPADWLAELTRWRMALARVRLLLIPTSPGDRAAVGVLVLTGSERPTPSKAARSYVCRAGRLYHPADAVLFPAVTDDELSRHLMAAVSVLHPSAGLVGCPASECLSVAALLSGGLERLADWSFARPGEPVRERIDSVLPDVQPTVEVILRSDRGGIGESPMQLPPQFPGQNLMRSVGEYLQKLARSGKPSGGRSGGGGGLSGMGGLLSTLGGWAANLANLQALRTQQLQQLMRLLQTDPDQALRFALPLAGDAGRGRAPPGAFLAPRDVNFDLDRLMRAGGVGSDPWMAPPDLFQALYQQYRSLAEREMALGRHRRAAYIFAELLGDFPSAVAALKQGRHFREAAILYRDRLQNPLEAARCFLEGGHLQEAVALYEEHQHFERAGDLWVRLERMDRAEANFRKAVQQLLHGGNTVQAALLLETKLAAPEEALQTLSAAWPPKSACLKAQFDLLGRLGRHDAAADLVDRVRQQALPTPLRVSLATTLAEVASSYPQREARDRAANVTRIVVADALATTLPASDLEQVLKAITTLAPEDRLLRTDGNRFREQRQNRPVPAKPPGNPFLPRLDRTLTLPGQMIAWTTATAGSGTLYVAGYGRLGPIVVRCRWDDKFDFTDWAASEKKVTRSNWPVDLSELAQLAADEPPMLFALGYHSHVLYPLGKRLPKQLLHVRGGGSETFGIPQWFPQNVIGLSTNGDLIWIVRVTDDGPLVLSLYRQDGALLATQGLFDPATTALPVPAGEDSADITDTVWDLSAHLIGREPLPMLCRHASTFLGLGNTLLKAGHGVAPESVALKRRILTIAASYGHSCRKVAVAFDHGGAIVNAETMQIESEFLETTQRPSIGFTLDDRFVAAGDDAALVIAQNGRHLPWTPPRIRHRLADLLPTTSPEGFGLISLEGRVLCFVIDR